MADNVLTQSAILATIPSGTTIAADEIAGVLYQRVKLTAGADGTAVDVSAAAPLPVDTEIKTADLDLGGGTDTQACVGLLTAVSGGARPVSATDPLPVNVVAGSAANAAASNTGAGVPAAADYTGLNVAGTLRGATAKAVGGDFAQSIAVVDASGNQITSFGGTAGVVSTDHTVTANGTNAKSIASGARKLRSVHGLNIADYPVYAKFHDTAGVPTAGAGVVFTVALQAGVSRDVPIPGGGKSFASGLGMTVVKGISDSDATAVVLNDANIEVCYE